jgi:hypothetical protein
MMDFSSICCNALVRVGGERSTHWWVCTCCGQPTDVTSNVDLESQRLRLLSNNKEGVTSR